MMKFICNVQTRVLTSLIMAASLAVFAACTRDKKPANDDDDQREQTTPTNPNQGNNQKGTPNQNGPSQGGSQNQNPNNQQSRPQPMGQITLPYKPLAQPLTKELIKQWADQDRAKNSAASEFLRYTYMPTQFVNDPVKANQARVALFKAINSVNEDHKDEPNRPALYIGRDASDGHGMVYAIDIQQIWGTKAKQKWGWVARAKGTIRPRGFFPESLREKKFPELEPVAIDQLVYNLLHSSVYADLIESPDDEGQFRRKIALKHGDVKGFVGFHEAIVIGPRVAWVSELSDGRLYWGTGDEFFGREEVNLPYVGQGVDPTPELMSYTHRLDIRPPGRDQSVSEAWMDGHNGLPRYIVWGEGNQNRAISEYAFVSDPFNKINERLHTGRSCVVCHRNGPQSAPNDMTKAINEGQISPEYIDAARQKWMDEKTLNYYYARSAVKFKDAMTKIAYSVSDNEALNKQFAGGSAEEPVNLLIMNWEFPRGYKDRNNDED